MKNTPQSYGPVSKLFHWLLFALLFCAFALGLTMTDMELSPDKLRLYQLHKSFGIAIMGVALLRLLWRLLNPVPEMPAAMARWEKQAAHVTHAVLYILMLLVPLIGWIMSSASGYPVSVFGLFVMPNLVQPDKELAEFLAEVHETLAWGMLALVGLHVAAALKHHFINKDNVLRRMLPFGCLLLLAFPANAADLPAWQIDYAQSKVAFTASYAGTDVNGKFDHFTATIQFDEKNLDQSRISAEIDLSSVNSENVERDMTLLAADWFSVKEFPKAVFTSGKITAIDKESYRAEGELLLRGVKKPLTLDFTFSKFEKGADGAIAARAEGKADLRRLDFGVGQGQWAKTDQIADKVAIRITIAATGAKPQNL